MIDKIPRKKILITGGTGLLGSALIEELGYLYDCIPLAKSSIPDNGVKVNLTDKNESNNILNKIFPDIVIHAAALTDVDNCEKNLKSAFQLNVQATRYIVDWILKQNKSIRLIYISTDSVYDNCESGCGEEVASPSNIYSLTKLWAEDLVNKVDNSLILRTNFYAAHGRRGIVDWITRSIDQNTTLTLFTDIKFNPLYLGQLTNIILKCLSVNAKGIFNLGASGKGILKSDFIKLVAKYFSLSDMRYVYGRSSDVSFMLAERSHDMTMSVNKFEKEFGFSLPSLESGVAVMYEDSNKNKNL
jgi:dTDP-4-dehydrorhamnose reductase